MDLFTRSIAVILEHQSPGGAYVACPNFPTYHYCWFRDGSFTAYAMDLAGRPESAACFHDWAAQAVNQREAVIHRAIARAAAGLPLEGSDILHTRYRLDGEEGSTQEWPNFQLDGFGTWLWALEQHLARRKQPPAAGWIRAAGLVADYLQALWRQPCYDCWEEFPDKVHPHTLAAIYAGLGACSRLDGCDRSAVQAEIRDFLLGQAVYDGHFVKFTGSYTVDASLLGLAVPYGVVPPDDPRMLETVRRIESSLRRGGVHRYPTDTYYGGGEWVLLAAWLGWYYVELGEKARAGELLAWVEAQAAVNGDLPEQAPASLIDANMYKPWVDLWGPIASPLLWSHAQYIILKKTLA